MIFGFDQQLRQRGFSGSARQLQIWLVSLLAGLTILLPLTAQIDATAATPFTAFEEWWQQYVAASPTDRAGLIKEGTALAKTRCKAMGELIETDPAKAIQSAFAEEYHSALPNPVGELVERHVRALGKLTVTKDKSGIAQRRVTIEKESWKAYLYGPRLELGSREEIPIHGVVLEGRIAVDGSPLERFPNRESLLGVLRQSEGKKTCPICGEPGVIPGAIGDILMWFDSDEHLLVCEKALIEKETNPEVGE